MADLRDDRSLILSFLEDLRDLIARESHAQGRVATGRTVASIQPLVSSTIGGVLEANETIFNTEFGTSPAEAQRQTFRSLVESLEVWKRAKGLPESLNAYAIAHTLRKRGSRLFREGGHSGVLTKFITETKLDGFTETLAAKYLQEANSQLFS